VPFFPMMTTHRETTWSLASRHLHLTFLATWYCSPGSPTCTGYSGGRSARETITSMTRELTLVFSTV